jgi:hypothetical protein
LANALSEIRAELDCDDLIVNEVQPGPGGRVISEVDPAEAYHFQRRGG